MFSRYFTDFFFPFLNIIFHLGIFIFCLVAMFGGVFCFFSSLFLLEYVFIVNFAGLPHQHVF